MKKIVLAVMLCLQPVLVQASTFSIHDAFGANIHLRQRIIPADWAMVMQQAQNTGVQWGREEFNWDVVESIDDQYSFTQYDQAVQAYQAHNIQILGLLTYSSKWAATSEFDPPNMMAWQDYVGTVADHYKDNITYWEIWNEPNNSGFWKSDAATYALYLEAAANAIKTKNPNAKIVLGGLSGADTDFLTKVYKNLTEPNIMDVVAVHPYRQVGSNFNYAPEDTVNNLNTLVTDLYNVKAVSRYWQQKTVPIWLTEVGWTTAAAGVSEQTQADYLTRLYTIALSVPDVQKVFWYSLTDTASDPTLTDKYFGLFTNVYTDKPAKTAYQFIKNKLDNTTVIDAGLTQVKLFDNFNRNQGWHIQDEVCTTGNVKDRPKESKLRISYQFGKGNCYAPIMLEKNLPLNTRSIQLKLKGNNDDTTLRVRIIDKSGETFQYNLGYMPAQWLRYTVQLSSSAAHWGGNNNGVINQPIKAVGFVLDNNDIAVADNEEHIVRIDDLAVSTRTNQYLTRFQVNNQNQYALWGMSDNKTASIFLSNTNTVTTQLFNSAQQQYSSSTGRYQLPVTTSVEWVQSL